MNEKILVPVLGESITEATVSKWLKNEGDTVNVDEPIVELETDKVNLEVPSPVTGVLTKINSKDGSVVGNTSGRDNLFRVNSNATTGNVTIAANNNASTVGPLTIGNGTTLTISSTGRLAII